MLVRSSALGIVVTLATLAGGVSAQAVVEFPMFVESSTGQSVDLRPAAEALEGLAGLHSVVLSGFPLPGQGSLDLVLSRFEVEPPTMFLDGNPVEIERDRSLSIWSGEVLGDPQSQVFLSFSVFGTRGWVRWHGETYHVLAGPSPSGDWRESRARVLSASELDVMSPREVATCGVTSPAESRPIEAEAGYATTLPMLKCRIAVETDYFFYDDFFGSMPAIEAYVESVFAAASQIYEQDIAVKLHVDSIGVHSSDPETPYDWPTVAIDDSVTTNQMLNAFEAAWGNGNIPNGAHLGHFLTPTDLGGGRAVIDKLCKNLGLAVSGNLWLCCVPGDIFQGPMIWDTYVVAHETGHNFNGKHTHEFCPPIDQCAPPGDFGPCQSQQVCGTGTIMSYCHQCPGVYANILPAFHATNITRMRNAAETSCLPFEDPQLVPGAFATIQAAINNLKAENVIEVLPGTYHENIDFKGKALTVVSQAGPGVTVLDGGGSGSVVTFKTHEGRDSVIEGFTITGGSALRGGGILCKNRAAPTIRGNVITGNVATGGTFNSSHLLGGGGICLDSTDYTDNSENALLEDNVIVGNDAQYWGGGILMSRQFFAELTGNLIAENTAYFSAGVTDYLGIAASYVGNTITANTASGDSMSASNVGGMFAPTAQLLKNNIVWGNTFLQGTGFADGYPGGLQLNNILGDVEPIATAPELENLQIDPHFHDATNGDFRLAWGSPAIDAGYVLDPLDPDGSRVDIGAFTFDPSVYNPWTDLGYGLAGSGGVTPVLEGHGSTAPGSSVSLSLESTLPSSSAYAFLSFQSPYSPSPTPFQGGTLIAVPISIILDPPFPTGGGDLWISVTTSWAWGAGAIDLVFQFWVVDAGGPSGYSASNGLLLQESPTW